MAHLYVEQMKKAVEFKKMASKGIRNLGLTIASLF